MNDIFGLPMSGLMTGLVLVLAVCLLMVAVAAWRRPVIFKMGVRNIPRRKAQTTLIVVGLMLSTLIISAALGTGDTLHYSLTKDSYENLGHVDQLVVASNEYEAPNADSNVTFDASMLSTVDGALTDDPNVDGVMPILDARVSAVNETMQQAEPAMILIGADPSRFGDFGGLKGTNGESIDLATIAIDGVVLSDKAADDLDAAVGDKVSVYYEGVPHALTVAAIAEDTYLSGYRRGREDFIEYPGMVMPLAAVQTITGQENLLTAIAISGTGGIRDGFKQTDDVIETLRPTLAGTGLGVDAIKRFSVDDGEKIAGQFTSIFLILGLFSIVSGLLLIVLIFTMLAAERRSEMGMARAVGTHRKQLIHQFVSEGAGYALLAGLVGSALGVAASVGIANAMKFLFGQYVPIEPHVEPRSMIVAYCLGVVITFVTIVVSSWKVSKLNVVAAIRDIPDIATHHRKLGTLIWGIVMLIGGGFMTLTGLSGEKAFFFYMGASLIPFGIAQILRYFKVPSRPVLSLAGIYILVLWLLPENIAEKIWGELDGDMEMFFLSGLFMVAGATILTMQNTDLLLSGVSKLGGLFKGTLPAVRTAVAYPSAARGRTGMTIAMFSLIVFSLVMMATMSTNFGGDKDANAGWDVVANTRGDKAIPNLTTDLESAGVDTSGYEATGVTTNPSIFSSEVKLPAGEEWKLWPVIGMDSAFIENSVIKFQQRAEGYASDDEIMAALKSQPNVAVIDSFAIPQGGLGGGSDSAFELTGISSDDDNFAPITVDLAAQDGTVSPVTIIGIIDEEISSLYGMYTNQATVDSIYPTLTSTSYFVALKDADRSDAVSKEIEAAMLQRGVLVTSIHDQIKDAEKQETGFLYLIEGFMGLGLLVGVAAVGVIAFRSVVERRQQIGVLRALGFQRSLVSLGFLIETGFVVGIGTITGTLLGVVLARSLLTGDSFGSPVDSFRVPWVLILVILVATVTAALSMTWLPSRQAGRIAPAEALRYE